MDTVHHLRHRHTQTRTHSMTDGKQRNTFNSEGNDEMRYISQINER